MRKVPAALFILSILLAGIPGVLSETYEIPGSYNPTGAYEIPYNNIGISELVMVDLNVTMVNTAQYPKFIIVNPRYDFKVHRLDGSENMSAKIIGGDIYHIPGNIEKTTLNYYAGFWIMPYETVKVEFKITDQNPYVVQTYDYQSLCGDQGKITNVSYIGDEFAGGVIEELDQVSLISCGVIYPQLVNSPEILSLESMFPLRDESIKILDYKGLVRMVFTNVPGNPHSCSPGTCEEGAFGEFANFTVFFAATVPLVFKEAKMYDYTPDYTMTLKEYLDTYYRKESDRAPQGVEVKLPVSMFGLSDKLITGVSIPSLQPAIRGKKSALEEELPVWIIMMKGSVEITYWVSWKE